MVSSDSEINKIDAIASFIKRITEDGEEPSRGTISRPDYACDYCGSEGSIRLSWQDFDFLTRLVRHLRTDSVIAENTHPPDVRDLLVHTLARAASHHEGGTFNARSMADSVWVTLTAGIEDRFILTNVPGLDMAAGNSITMAGMTIGPLSDEIRQSIKQRAEDTGMYLADNPEKGSGLPLMLQFMEDLYEGEKCWAWGVIRANEANLTRIALERVNVEALNVLRCFAPNIREEPDRLSLGLPDEATMRKTLHYPVRTVGKDVIFSPGFSRISNRIPFVLDNPNLEYLRELPAFQRALQILDLTSRSTLDERLYLAMLQFGTVSSYERPEFKLPNYLTVLEVLLLVDKERNHHDKKIGDRLGILLPNRDVERCKDLVTTLYAVRQRPVHRGEKNLRGQEIVPAQYVKEARYLAHAAIMHALEQTEVGESHEHFIDRLRSAKLQPHNHTSSYDFLVKQLSGSSGYEATCQDFPNCAAYGSTIGEAQARLKTMIVEEISRLVELNLTAPEPSQVLMNSIELEVPTHSFPRERYLSKVRARKHRDQQRLLYMRGGSMTVDQIGVALGVGKKEVNRRRRANLLIALPEKEGHYIYPRWQIVGTQVVLGLSQVLKELHTGDPWQQAAFFLNPCKGIVHNSPLDALLAGHVDEVILIAKLYGRSGCSEP